MDFIHYALQGSCITLAETIIYWIFSNGLYERKQRGWKCGLILAVFPTGLIIANYCYDYYGLPMGLKVIFMMIVAGIITKLLFYVNWRNIIVNLSIWVLSSILSDGLSVGLTVITKDYVNMNEIFNNPKLYIQFGVLAKIVNLVIIIFFIKKFGKAASRYTITETLIFLLQGITGFACIFTLIVSANNISHSNNKMLTLSLVIVSVLVLTSYIVFYSIFDSYVKKRNLEQEVMKVHFYNQGQYEYYTTLEQENLNMKKMYHDIKYHLLAIQSLNKESIDSSDTYIQKCLEEVESYNEFFDTGNKLADIILYEKCNLAKKNNIKTKIMIQKDSLNNLEMLDLCAILTNSFDNAMAGCIQCKEDRFIQIKALKNDAAVIITVKNNYETLPAVNKKGDLITSKQNKAELVLGMQSLKMAASKYNGDVEISIDKKKKEFLVFVMIPLANQKAS